MKNKRVKRYIARTAAVVLAVLMTTFFAACSGGAPLFVGDEVYAFPTSSSLDLGTVARNLPEVFDGGLERYPEYGKSLSFTAAEKAAIKAENAKIFNYDAMDADGNLYKNGEPAEIHTLKKHSASVGMYFGDIADTVPAVAKRIRITPVKYGNNMTGLYAPPGEVVTVILSEKDAKRNMRVQIGQCAQRQGGITIPENKDFTRMPSIKKDMTLKNVENYIGSPLGGPIYIMNEGDGLAPYEVTIIGAVEMPHYILGGTTDEAWERLRYAPAPMFDLETYAGVRLTMSASNFVRSMSASEIRTIAEYWDKSAQLANRISNGNWFSTHPVTMIYDTYVPAGAAVAFVGADFCVLPTGWATGAVNYKSIVTSGQWGNLHEMNHHHQGWGAGNNGEVTNNVINAMIYCMYTNVASSRTEDGGLSGWNWVTSAYSSLNRTLGLYDKNRKNQDLSMYVDLLHAFGTDAMIEMANKSRANNENAWFKAVCDVTGYDMTYFLRDVCKLNIDQDLIDEVAAKKLPMFVPVANLYQSGRDIITNQGDMSQKMQVEMGRPFYIPFGKQKELDLAGYTAVPNGISYEIKNVTAPKYGKLETVKDENGGEVYGKYLYTPKSGSSSSDEFYMTLSLKNDTDAAITFEDVTLKISLAQDVLGVQGHIWENVGWSDIDAAIGDQFETAAKPIESVDYSYAGTSDSRPSTLTVVEGKIAMPIAATYQFFIKGDDSVKLYTGFEKDKLELSAHVDQYTANYSRDLQGSYFSVKMEPGKPLYFKMYVQNIGGKGWSRIGYADRSQMQGATPVAEDGSGGDNVEANLPIVDLPSSFVYQKESDILTPGRADIETDRAYARKLTASAVKHLDIKGITVTSSTPMYDNRDHMGNITDGNENTSCHTKPGVVPAEFIFDLKSAQTFNSMSMTFLKNSTRGRIKDYALYFATSPLDFKTEGREPDFEGTFASAYRVNSFFPKVTARYVKIVATSVYDSNGQKIINISTVKFGNGIQNGEIAPQSGSDIKYMGNWRANTFGTFLNGAAYETSSGSLEVNFHGTDFALFAKTGPKYAQAQIRLDGGKWQTIDFYSETDQYNQPVFVTNEITDGYHKIEIRAKGMINIDYMAFKPTAPPQPTQLAVIWWVLIGIAIAAVCAGIGIGAFFLTKRVKERGGLVKKKAQLPDQHDMVISSPTMPVSEASVFEQSVMRGEPEKSKKTAPMKRETSALTANVPIALQKTNQPVQNEPIEWLYTPNKSSGVDVLIADTTSQPKIAIQKSEKKIMQHKSTAADGKVTKTSKKTVKPNEKQPIAKSNEKQKTVKPAVKSSANSKPVQRKEIKKPIAKKTDGDKKK